MDSCGLEGSRTGFVQKKGYSETTFDDFTERVEIGSGKDCKIYACTWKHMPDRRVAVKAYDKSKISSVKLRSIKREARVMHFLSKRKVPNSVEFYMAFQDEERLYVVMEHCCHGDLLDHLLKEGHAMTEKQMCHEVAIPILTTLSWMHDFDIIHRDIKLENIFIDSQKQLRLGDYGLSMSMREERAISPVGTLEYMAPELVRLPPADLILKGEIKAEDVEGVDEKVDIWALGVTVYELVTGRSPFEGKDKAEIKKSILDGRMRPLPSFLSAECCSFILQMMSAEAKKRPSAVKLLQHPFILKFSAGSRFSSNSGRIKAGLASVPLPQPAAPSVRSAEHKLGAVGGLQQAETRAAAGRNPERKGTPDRPVPAPAPSPPPAASKPGSLVKSGSFTSSSSLLLFGKRPQLPPPAAAPQQKAVKSMAALPNLTEEEADSASSSSSRDLIKAYLLGESNAPDRGPPKVSPSRIIARDMSKSRHSLICSRKTTESKSMSISSSRLSHFIRRLGFGKRSDREPQLA